MQLSPLDIGLAAPSVETSADFDELYAHYFDSVTRWVRRLGGPRLEVDDLVQEIFVIAFQGLPRRSPHAPLASWLFRITQNVVHHQRRGQRWRELLFGVPIESLPALQGADGRDDVAVRDTQRLLYRALDGLAERYRVPLVLFEIDGQSAEEIAILLDVRVSAVWTRLSRGREKLLSKFEALERSEDIRRGGHV